MPGLHSCRCQLWNAIQRAGVATEHPIADYTFFVVLRTTLLSNENSLFQLVIYC